MNKKIFLVLLLALMIIPLCDAIKPSTATSSLSQGLQISYPAPYFLEVEHNLSIRFWVYNSSNGDLLTNTTINCTYNLLNNYGKNTVRYSTDDVNLPIMFGKLGSNACANCFNLELSGGNLSKLGYYSYQIRCKGQGQGGYIIGDYLVNPSGTETDASEVTAAGFSMVLLMLITFFFFVLSIIINTKSLKLFFISISGLTLVVMIGIMAANYYYLEEFKAISEIMNGYYIIALALGGVGVLALVIWLVYEAVISFNKTRGRIIEDD